MPAAAVCQAAGAAPPAGALSPALGQAAGRVAVAVAVAGVGGPAGLSLFSHSSCACRGVVSSIGCLQPRVVQSGEAGGEAGCPRAHPPRSYDSSMHWWFGSGCSRFVRRQALAPHQQGFSGAPTSGSISCFDRVELAWRTDCDSLRSRTRAMPSPGGGRKVWALSEPRESFCLVAHPSCTIRRPKGI